MSSERSLWDLQPSESAAISKLDPAILAKHETRLKDLGFSTGETVVCLRWLPFGGPRVFRVGDSVLSLDREVGEKVKVRTGVAT